MAHFLLTPFGSAGDVNPFLWLGRHLQARGHEVEMLTAPMFEEFAAKSGITFTGIGTAEEFDRILTHPDLWKPYRGTQLVFEYSAKFLRRTYELIASRVRVDDTVLVSPFHQFAARLAREKFNVPLVNVHLQPACFLSVHDTPLLVPGTEWLLKAPRWLKRLAFSLPNPASRKLTPELRRVCRELGVKTPRRILPDWMHSPDANLALFPEWFAAPQPDWPPHTHAIGFPLEDMKGRIAMPAELDAWLREGDKPVLFSPGTGNVQAREFFECGIAACDRLGMRALLGTRFPEQLPDPLPSHARHFDYLPFSELLPRVSALVHHGGIGTLSQALAAGVPQLVMPMAHDQPDNARRLKKLGVGDVLAPKQFSEERVAERLRELVKDRGVADACASVADLCRKADAASEAVGILEGVALARPK
jgi:UDP:flavonoid glycosyltransferase YjiC (YdhE family)